MKTRRVLGLLTCLAVLFASSEAGAAPRKRGTKGAKKPAVVHAVASQPKASKPKGATKPASLASLPAAASKPTPATKPAATTASQSAPAAASKSANKASRFLASGVPLVEVREGRLGTIGTKKLPCGAKASWAKSKSRWHALDAWGRVTGTLTVAGSERYSGSGCHEVRFGEGTGRDGLGVFVAAGSGYAAAPSVEWKPDADVAKRFDALYAAQQSAWVDSKIEKREQHRTLFFELPKQEASAFGAATQRRPTRWAVSGGRVLVVGYLGATGVWKVAHVLSPTGKERAYEPLAIFDMNGDGLPEIVVHEEAGGVFVDRVLSFDAGTMRWENAVASPGGATR